MAESKTHFCSPAVVEAAAAASATAGLQKWVYNSTAGEWQLAYTLQNGLNLGAPYSVRGYPTGVNSVTGLPCRARRCARHYPFSAVTLAE